MKTIRKESTDTISIWVMWIIVAAGVVVRLPQLGYSFYGDEGFSLLRDSSKFFTDSEDRFRPVFFSLLFLWKQIGFSGEIGLRLLPLLFGIAQMPLAFLIGRELKGAAFGIAFTVVVAASPLLIEFSQELRMYSLVTALAMTQVWILLRLIRPRLGGTPSAPTGWWIAFAATAILGVYTHLFYWLFLFGCLLTMVRERKDINLRHGFYAVVAVVVFYLPNISNLLNFTARRSDEYGFYAPSAIPKLLAAFTVGFNYFMLPEQSSGRAVGWQDLIHNGWITALAILTALIILWRVIWMHAESSERRTLWYCHEWFTVPVLLAVMASYTSNKYFLQPKYIIFCAPFMLLMIANAFLTIRMSVAKRVTAGLGTAIFAIAMIHFWTPTDYGRRENWKGVAEILSTTDAKDTAILLLPGSYGLLYYYAPGLEGRLPMVRVPLSAEADLLLHDDLVKTISGRKIVYYVRHDIAQNIEDPDDLLPHVMNSIGTIGGVARFNPRLSLYDWRISAGG